ncbi:hypothetical protein ACQP3L_35260, partial [Escherichia coli]
YKLLYVYLELNGCRTLQDRNFSLHEVLSNGKGKHTEDHWESEWTRGKGRMIEIKSLQGGIDY